MSFKKNLTTLFLVCAFFLAVILVVPILPTKNNSLSEGVPKVDLTVGERTISAEIADTDAKRTQGLSGRNTLAKNEGMLFVFPKADRWGFWMKDMYFPIDIIWLDEDFRVIGAAENIAPETFPQVFYPPEPIQFVLEVPAGTTNATVQPL